MTNLVELYLLRHADAGDPEKWRGDDALRPLSAKGERQAEALAGFLAARDFKPDTVISSPKVRARRTAEIVADALKLAVDIDAQLAEPLDLDVVDDIVRGTGGSKVVMVGHDPDFSELAADLVGVDELPLKKGALIRIDCPLPLRARTGTLRWLLPPELLR